ncbi:helix-turn-helix domain-containing protein [Kocuria sediminis]|uniref:Helix-turn-helix domain-containing protein n=1 Tax=Kocuria sediminis TaxID=1038857 RepID=A0A6N8GQM4_9MICC|nr:AraC family transcriptional regulator [Kocuria sediminis]MUN63255.1 helix-turn-helix domain-containing protein [Kocuria sediminis]
MSVIRSAGLRGFRAAVAELGGDAEALADAAGLPRAALDTDDLLVPERAVGRVLETAARELACPDLGLRVAARQDPGVLGPLALAARHSETVRDALECVSRYLFVHAPSLELALVEDPYGARGVTAVRYGGHGSASRAGRGSPQGTDLGLGLLHRALTSLVGGRYGLRTVDLDHRPAAPLRVYEEFFGVPVRPGRPEVLLRIPTSTLAQPLHGDAGVRQVALAFLDAQIPGAGSAWAPRVRGVLVQLLGTAAPELEAVARVLDLHPRTLQRRLAEEGTTFGAVLDEARRSAALRWLTTTEVPLSQIAGLVGLSESSALTRCARRWWGAPPRDVRRGAARTG